MTAETDARALAAIPTKPLGPDRPHVAFVQGDDAFRNLLLSRSDIDRVIMPAANRKNLLEFRRGVGSAKPVTAPIAALPVPRLELKSSVYSQFYAVPFGYRGPPYAFGSPFQLNLVDATGSQLVAVWYRSTVPPPRRLPLLSAGSWMREKTVQLAAGGSDEREAFIDAALGKVVP